MFTIVIYQVKYDKLNYLQTDQSATTASELLAPGKANKAFVYSERKSSEQKW